MNVEFAGIIVGGGGVDGKSGARFFIFTISIDLKYFSPNNADVDEESEESEAVSLGSRTPDRLTPEGATVCGAHSQTATPPPPHIPAPEVVCSFPTAGPSPSSHQIDGRTVREDKAGWA
ncbi:hypothetical protein C0Q70_16780 [Pomacea canaliculata]|uniref:Uncharacterized protein n=1 Tax=Pomacea canaliculata TaxID=400727 RepID=A0A2T7NQR8_POMCA|nr:hypothetical protein C0Q70_16780 [Pomacea canaliculata]